MKKTFLKALLLTAAAILLLNLFCVVRYETGDDFMINRFASGVSAPPDYHFYYINDLWGRLITGLYRLNPAVPWYGILEYLILGLSMTACIFVLLLRRHPLSLFFISLTLFVFGYEFLIKVQYTKVGACAGLSGVLLLITLLELSIRKPWLYGYGIVLVILGSFYRPVMFFAALGTLFPYGLWRIIRASKESGKRFRSYLILFPCVLLLCGLLYGIHARDYQGNDGWAGYKTFLDDERQLNDYGYPSFKKHRETYEALDINQNALAVYQNMGIADPDKYNDEVIKTQIAAKDSKKITPKKIGGFFELLGQQFLVNYPYTLALFAALLVMILRRRRFPLIMAFSLLIILAFHFLLYMKGRVFFNRVDTGLYFGAFLSACLLSEEGEGDPVLKKSGSLQAAGVFLILLVTCVRYAYLPPKQNSIDIIPEDVKKSEEEREYQKLVAGDTANLYFISDYSGPAYCTPFDVLERDSVTNQIQLGSWQSFSPVDLFLWERNGVENPYRSLATRPDALLQTAYVDSYIQYLNDYYGEDLYGVVIKSFPDHYPLIRITSDELTAERLDFRPEEIPENGDLVTYTETVLEGDSLVLRGSAFLPGDNSFNNLYYVCTQKPGGEVSSAYVTQLLNPFAGDLYNGKYSAFEVRIPAPAEDEQIYLIYENGENRFKICLQTP